VGVREALVVRLRGVWSIAAGNCDNENRAL
jgi:hypothetical protein